MIDIFNPFSLVNAFAKLDMGSYWFERGTPGYLVKLIRKLNRLFKDIAPVEVDANYLESAGVMSSDPVPAFYQSGYMTIKDYSPQTRTYILDYPNEEVKEGFLKYLFQMYVPEMIPGSGFSIPDFMGFVRKGNADGFMKSLASLIAGVPYSEKGSAEAHFQNAIYLLFTLLGYFTFIEQRTSNGRIDLIVETSEYIYLFEFKVDSSSDSEIKQMEEKQYWLPYLTSQKEIILIGANFNTSSRTLDSYIISKVERH